MPGFLLHLGATVTCAHPPGQASPQNSSPRVKVSGQPIVVQTSLYSITACGQPAATSGVSPACLTAQWESAATRVRAGNTPVLLQDSQSKCVPTGTPLIVVMTQLRVKGT